MAKKLPITKRLKDEIFVWDPTAFQNKGYWYILGTTGAYGRPASSAERIKLGAPPKAETTPESPAVSSFMDSPQLAQGSRRRTYRKKRKLAGRQDFRTGPLKEIIFQKLFNDGKTIRNALEEALSEKAKAKVASFKDKFDPMNIITKIYGDKIGAVIGRAIGRKESDIQKFTGYGKNEEDVEDDRTGRISAVKNKRVGKIPSLQKSTATPEAKQKGGSDSELAKMLDKIYGALKNTYDLDLTKKDNGEKLKKQKDAWNKELIKTITGNPQNDVSKLTLKEFDSFRKILLEKLKEITETVSNAGGSGPLSMLPDLPTSVSEARIAAAAGKTAVTGAFAVTKTVAAVTGVASKEAIETAAKKILPKNLLKSVATKIPFLSVATGLIFATQRMFNGDTTGAKMDLVSGVVGAIPGAGIPGSLAIDVASAARDIYKEVYQVQPEDDPEFKNRIGAITEVVEKLLKPNTEKANEVKDSPTVAAAPVVLPEDPAAAPANAPSASPVSTDKPSKVSPAVDEGGVVAPIDNPVTVSDANTEDSALTPPTATEVKAPEMAAVANTEDSALTPPTATEVKAPEMAAVANTGEPKNTSTTTYSSLAGEPLIPGKPLSKLQMDVIDIGKSMGNSYSPDIEEKYNKQKMSIDSSQSPDTGNKLSAGSIVNQNLTSETTNGGSIVADNSKKITVINQNTDGLTVEQLTGVRLEESTFKKIARQNLHMV
jgi:hypothetical protein